MSAVNDRLMVRSDSDEISLFALAATLVRARRRLFFWGLAGGLLMLALVFRKPALYQASTSFVPVGNDASRSSLSSLAGQFGLSFPSGGGQAFTPDFYVQLLRSRVLLEEVARDTFTVREQGGRRVAALDLFKTPGAGRAAREENFVEMLGRMVSVAPVKSTGIVRITVASEWPSVSEQIIKRLLRGIQEFNQRTRVDQAVAERRMVESQLAAKAAELRAAEDNLEQWLKSNRQWSTSPELVAQKERIERDLGFKVQVYTSLAQAYQDVRLKEVRDVPAITVVEPTLASTKALPRGRLRSIVLGIALGLVIGAALAIGAGVAAKLRRSGDPEVEQFIGELNTLKGQIARPFRRSIRGGPA